MQVVVKPAVKLLTDFNAKIKGPIVASSATLIGTLVPLLVQAIIQMANHVAFVQSKKNMNIYHGNTAPNT